MRLPDVELISVADSTEILKKTEVIITATTSDIPVLPDDQELLKGKKIIAMGSYRKDMRELPDAVFKLSRRILIDAPGTRLEVGDVLYPVQQGLVQEEDVLTLGSVLTGKHTLTSGTAVFKSAGYALFDLFVARQLYTAALHEGKGTSFDF
jgi:ornithine cyclodeaminase